MVDSITYLYKEFEGFLEQQQYELEKSNLILLKCCKKQLIELINENLPDGMNVRKLEDIEDKWKITLSSNEGNQPTNSKKKSKGICFYNKEEKPIGEMVLTEAQEELLIRIKILDEVIYQDFKIDNTLRVFPMVNYIITKYNYKEEFK